MNLGGSGIEILELELADFAAIHSVGVIRSEPLDIELHDTAADFLIRSKADFDVTMLELRMLYHVLHSVHNFCDTSLVISAEKSGSVSGDDGLALVCNQLRELGRLQIEARRNHRNFQ